MRWGEVRAMSEWCQATLIILILPSVAVVGVPRTRFRIPRNINNVSVIFELFWRVYEAIL